jgi:hypothetical protein
VLPKWPNMLEPKKNARLVFVHGPFIAVEEMGNQQAVTFHKILLDEGWNEIHITSNVGTQPGSRVVHLMHPGLSSSYKIIFDVKEPMMRPGEIVAEVRRMEARIARLVNHITLKAKLDEGDLARPPVWDEKLSTRMTERPV